MKALILWGIGMSGGIAVAAGLFTFLVITGIPHRLMTITHTTAYGGWDALPVFFKRIGIRQGIGVVIFWMAVGKTLGAWMWYFILT